MQVGTIRNLIWTTGVAWAIVACGQNAGSSAPQLAQSSIGNAKTIEDSNSAELPPAQELPGDQIPPNEPLPQEPVPPIAAPQVSLQLGELAAGGKACTLPEGMAPVILNNDELILNVATTVTKTGGAALTRGACTIALPVVVPAGYRMVIDRIKASGHLLISQGTQITGALEVFTTGNDESASIDFNGRAARGTKLVRQDFDQEARIVTECGAGMNLRSNSSFVLRGGDSDSHAVFAGLKIHYALEACQ